MDDIIKSYLKGREEGYFNVRLANEILSKEPLSRAFFGKGYKLGEKIRKKEAEQEVDSGSKIYNEHRKAYITIMGYKSAYEYYVANSSLLKDEEDQRSFEEGCRIGLEYKDGNINELSVEDANLYAIIAGYNNAVQNGFNCMFIVKEENQSAFSTGYNVGKICKDIEKDAISELDETKKYLYGSNHSRK